MIFKLRLIECKLILKNILLQNKKYCKLFILAQKNKNNNSNVVGNNINNNVKNTAVLLP